MSESLEERYARKVDEMYAKLQNPDNYPSMNWDKASPGRSDTSAALSYALDHMRVLQSKMVPPGQVLVMNPATYQQLRPIELDWPVEFEPLRFKVMADYRAFALPKYRPFFQCDIAGEEPRRVKWIDEVPAPAVPAWQYAVLFAVGGLILFMLGGAL